MVTEAKEGKSTTYTVEHASPARQSAELELAQYLANRGHGTQAVIIDQTTGDVTVVTGEAAERIGKCA